MVPVVLLVPLLAGKIPLLDVEIRLLDDEIPLLDVEIPLLVGKIPLLDDETPLVIGELPLLVGDVLMPGPQKMDEAPLYTGVIYHSSVMVSQSNYIYSGMITLSCYS